MQTSRELITQAQTIVIKIGSSVLVENQKISISFFQSLAKEVTSLRKKGKTLLIVSSGAVACGMNRLSITKKPQSITKKQALAACGQTTLMHFYEKTFSKYNIHVAQVLLTREDLVSRQRYLNARQTLHELLHLEILPIINENDTVAVDEMKVGDNDNLAALVAHLVDADLLIILSDVDGLHTEDPNLNRKGERISIIDRFDDTIKKFALGTQQEISVGGMKTKLEAAEKAARGGALTVIAKGREKNVLYHILNGEDVGTLVLAHPEKLQLKAKKHWIAYSLQPKGALIVDVGAKSALSQNGKSLLPSGVQEVVGNFGRGDCLSIQVANEKPFGRGLANYSSEEIKKIKGLKTAEIEKRLHYKYSDEIIHRDDFVLLEDGCLPKK